MLPIIVIIASFFINIPTTVATPPGIYAPNGTYLGDPSANKLAPNSTNNPMGLYGSPLTPNGINNPMSIYGSPLSPLSPNNPYTPEAPMLPGPPNLPGPPGLGN